MGFLDYFHDDGSETKCCCYCSDMRQMFPKSLKIKTFKAILTIIIIIIIKKNWQQYIFFQTSNKVHSYGSDGLLTLSFKASPTQKAVPNSNQVTS